MSIANEITNYANGLSDAYGAVNDMQGIIPTDKNMNNLDTAIRTIPQNLGPTYTAGNGIIIDANDEISIDDTVVAELSDIGNGTLTIKRNGTTDQTFTANSSTNVTVDVQAPVRVDLTGQCQTTGYVRSVIALCKVNTVSQTSIDSFSSGRLSFHRDNGAASDRFIDFIIGGKYNPAYEYYFSSSSNLKLLGENENLDTSQGFRPCIFKYNNVWYAGIEYHAQNAQQRRVAFNGEKVDINIFALDYYKVSYTSGGTTVPSEILNQEVYDSLDYTKTDWGASPLRAKYFVTENGTIKNGDSYTATLPNKTGTVAMTSDLPTKTSDLTNDGADGNSTYLEADETAYKTASIPFGQCDNTSTATAFTASVPGITELRDGVCMWLKNGVINGSSAGFTLDINNLGAKPVYKNMGATSLENEAFGANYTYMFIYDSTRVAGGCWVLNRGYYSDSKAWMVRTNRQVKPVTDQTGRYRLLFVSPDGTKYIPANTSNSTSETAAKTPNTRAFDPFAGVFYYNASTILDADAVPTSDAVYQQTNNIYIGYSYSDGTTPAMTVNAPVYLKCTPQADGSAIIDSTTPYVQTLPNTEDGKIYIFLGMAYHARLIELMIAHPIYYYKDGSIRIWTNQAQGGGTTYTAGAHIDITNDVISAEGYIWGDDAAPASTPASTITSAMIVDGTIQATDIATGVVPVITMTDTDPGEGSPLAANNFVAVYGDDPSNMNYSLNETKTGATWIDGSPIYKKTISTGALPNTTTKNVAHNISNIDKVLSVNGFACSYRPDGNVYIPLPFVDTSDAYLIGAWVNGGNIVIRTGSDRTNYTESYVTLYYTKSS